MGPFLKFARNSGFTVRVAALMLLCPLAAQQPVAPQPATQQPSGHKVIQNPAEYNALVTAMNTKDDAARAASLEAFAQQYPHSVAYTDALEEEMSAWQSAGDMQKLQQTARQLLAADSGNVRALAIVVALDRNSAARGDKPSLNELCLYSTAGMREVPQWQKPYGMSEDDFNTLGNQMVAIFDGAAGYCAWQQKNYGQAQDWLSRAFALDKTDAQDAYQLAVVDFEIKPLDANGFWYCARAIHLAQGANQDDAADGMTASCKNRYMAYHGSLDGWDAVLAAGATNDTWPPADFGANIKPAPAATAPKK